MYNKCKYLNDCDVYYYDLFDKAYFDKVISDLQHTMYCRITSKYFCSNIMN